MGRVLAGSQGSQLELEDLRDTWLQLAKVRQGGREPYDAPLLPCHSAGAVVGLELDPHLPQQPWRRGKVLGATGCPSTQQVAGLCPPQHPS